MKSMYAATAKRILNGWKEAFNMGQKYMIYGFNYGDKFKHMRQTDWLIVAMFWSLVYGIKYDGVDISKRRSV